MVTFFIAVNQGYPRILDDPSKLRGSHGALGRGYEFLIHLQVQQFVISAGGEMDVRWVKIFSNLTLSENRCFFF